MSKGTGSSALILLGIFIAGGIFFLAAYGVYVYLDNAVAEPEVFPDYQPQEINVPAAVEVIEEEPEVELVDGLFVLPDQNEPDVFEGEQETTYRYSTADSITVAPADNESLMLHSIGASIEESVVVDGVESRRVIGSSAKDGSKVEVIIVPLEDADTILFIRGEEEFLATVEEDLVLE